MPQNTEATVSAALAEARRYKHPLWRDAIGAEQSGVFEKERALPPDIVVRAQSPAGGGGDGVRAGRHRGAGRRRALGANADCRPANRTGARRLSTGGTAAWASRSGSPHCQEPIRLLRLSGEPKANRWPTHGRFTGGLNAWLAAWSRPCLHPPAQREVDDTLGQATRAVMRRELEVFGDARFARLAGTSTSHLAVVDETRPLNCCAVMAVPLRRRRRS